MAEIGKPVRRRIIVPEEMPQPAPAEPERTAPAHSPEREPV